MSNPGPFQTTNEGGATPQDGATYIDAPTTDTPTTDENSQGSEVTGEDQSAGAKDYPEPQSAKGAFVNDAGIDLNEEADHGPNAQGNKYGVSGDASRGFRDAAEAEAKGLLQRLKELKEEYDKHNDAYNEAGGDAQFNDGEDSSENHVLANLDTDELNRNERVR